MDVLLDAGKSPFVICTVIYVFVVMVEFISKADEDFLIWGIILLYRDKKKVLEEYEFIAKYFGGFLKLLSYIGIYISIILYVVNVFGSTIAYVLYALFVLLLLFVCIFDLFIKVDVLLKTKLFTKSTPKSIYLFKKGFSLVILLVSYICMFLIVPEILYSIN